MKHNKIITLVLFLFFITVYSQTDEEIELIQEQSNTQVLNALAQKFTYEFESKKQYALEYAEQNGIPVIIENENGSFSELMEITKDGIPFYYTLDNVAAAISSRANHLNSGGSLGLNINGQSMTAHVWDGGPVRTTHQEYGSRVMIGDGATSLNGNSFHATHVTGTIAAGGVDPAAKGMANQGNAVTYNWANDLGEAATAAANGMLLSNHSYGADPLFLSDWRFGAYTSVSKSWDDIMYNAPYYLMVKTAGNDGTNNIYNSLPLYGNSTFDKLVPRATAKNGLVVAAANDANVNSNGSLISVTIASFSSQGPTDDLRIKPDIVGNGVGLYSSYDANDTDYNSISGTSMAAPNVTGSLLLLQQYYKSLNPNFMKAATLKGLVLHTADDLLLPGPDVVTGWGLINAKRAANVIKGVASSSNIMERTLSSGSSYSVIVESDGIHPLIASLSWTDPVGIANTGTANLTTPVLTNDLDIRIRKATNVYEPYKLTSITTKTTGDNIVDPYERVDISNASGKYVITVTHKGTLINPQDYSLIMSGIVIQDCMPNLSISTDVLGIDNQEADFFIVADNKIFPNATALYHAGYEVTLADGFEASNGSTFKAYIEGCTGSFVRLAENSEREVVRYNIKDEDKRNDEYVIVEDNFNESTLRNSLEIYPNPTKNTFNIQLKNQDLYNANIQIYTISGAEVYSNTVREENTNSLELNVSHFQSGLYIIKVVNSTGDVFMNKLIKE